MLKPSRLNSQLTFSAKRRTIWCYSPDDDGQYGRDQKLAPRHEWQSVVAQVHDIPVLDTGDEEERAVRELTMSLA